MPKYVFEDSWLQPEKNIKIESFCLPTAYLKALLNGFPLYVGKLNVDETKLYRSPLYDRVLMKRRLAEVEHS